MKADFRKKNEFFIRAELDNGPVKTRGWSFGSSYSSTQSFGVKEGVYSRYQP